MKAADVSRLWRKINTPSLHFVRVMPGHDCSTTLIQRRKAKQKKAKAAKKTGVTK